MKRFAVVVFLDMEVDADDPLAAEIIAQEDVAARYPNQVRSVKAYMELKD